MSRESFENLKEVQSLLKQEKLHLDNISSEEKRMTHILRQRDIHLQELSEIEEQQKLIRSEMSHLEKALAQKDEQLQQAKKAYDSAANQIQANSSSKQIATLSEVIESEQNELFQLMEKEETIQERVAEIKTFLAGVDNTIKEIQFEVDKNIAQEKKLIQVVDERVENLFSLCDKNIVFAFKESCKKHRYQNPLTQIQNKACRICNYMPEGILLSAIERGDEAHYCSGCYRLFSPL